MAFDLPTMKLLCLHVSEHRDETVVRPVWNQIFQQGQKLKQPTCHSIYLSHMQSDVSCSVVIDEDDDPRAQADNLIRHLTPLGQRFYPSESAFPLRTLSRLTHA